MTTLQEAARKSFEVWKKTGSCFYLSRNNAPGSDLDGYQDAYTQGQWVAWQAALAQQELPQKERPDFMAGYDAGMADAKRMAQQGEPQGWKLVPVEPTQEMLAKSWIAVAGNLNRVEQREFYSAMLAAAPAPQAQQGEPVAQARLGMKDGLAMALSVVELYGMKGDVIYREIAKLRDGIAAAPAPQAQQGEPVCHGCGIPAGDVHMSTCKSGKWPSRVSNGDTAAPAPQPAQGVPERRR